MGVTMNDDPYRDVPENVRAMLAKAHFKGATWQDKPCTRLLTWEDLAASDRARLASAWRAANVDEHKPSKKTGLSPAQADRITLACAKFLVAEVPKLVLEYVPDALQQLAASGDIQVDFSGDLAKMRHALEKHVDLVLERTKDSFQRAAKTVDHAPPATPNAEIATLRETITSLSATVDSQKHQLERHQSHLARLETKMQKLRGDA